MMYRVASFVRYIYVRISKYHVLRSCSLGQNGDTGKAYNCGLQLVKVGPYQSARAICREI